MGCAHRHRNVQRHRDDHRCRGCDELPNVSVESIGTHAAERAHGRNIQYRLFADRAGLIGGAPPYLAVQLVGQLPTGLTFNAATQVLSGTPLESGTFYPVFTFADASSDAIRLTESIVVSGGTYVGINSSANLGTMPVGCRALRTSSRRAAVP